MCDADSASKRKKTAKSTFAKKTSASYAPVKTTGKIQKMVSVKKSTMIPWPKGATVRKLIAGMPYGGFYFLRMMLFQDPVSSY